MLNLLDGYSINDLYFNLIIVISVVFLYYNSIDGNFIWDDRAAIVSASKIIYCTIDLVLIRMCIVLVYRSRIVMWKV